MEYVAKKVEGRYEIYGDNQFITETNGSFFEKKTGIRWGYIPKEYIEQIGRKLINLDKVDAEGELSLSKRVRSSQASSTSVKISNWLSMATPEELKIIDEIKDKCIKRLNDPEFIAREKLRKLLEEYETRFGKSYND